MAVVRASYGALGSCDMHLVPGMVSPQLEQLLVLDLTTGTIRADQRNKAAIGVGFGTNLVGPVADYPTKHGISLDTHTGEVRMTGTIPEAGLRRFIVTATVTEGGAVVARVGTRVHVHAGIDQLWLAPNILTLRNSARGVRLTVLALFLDGVIGDVTNWGAILPPTPGDTTENTFARRFGTRDPWLRWSPGDGSQVGVHEITGVLNTSSNTGGGLINVLTGWMPFPIRAAGATVRCAPSWTTNVPLKAMKGADFAKIAERTNVLILADGFEDTERAMFEAIAADLVKELQTNDRTRPFDLIKDQVNYFSAFVKSRQPGVSVLNEVFHNGPTLEGVATPAHEPDPSNGPPWTIEKLIAKVGLPSPVIDLPGSALPVRAQAWRDRFGIDFSGPDAQRLHDVWLPLSRRALVDDVDTAFHTGFGSRPSLSDPSEARFVALNPRRLDDLDFDAFLDGLYDPKGDPNHQRPFKRWSIGARDERNVVVICRSRRLGGGLSIRQDTRKPLANAKLIAFSLDDKDSHRLLDVPPRVTVNADHVTTAVSNSGWLAVAHEVAHTWGVADEYKGPHVLADKPLIRAFVDACGNVQARETLLVAVPPPAAPGTKTLDITNLKWRWPRIGGCGVLTQAPTLIGGHYLLALRAGHVVGNHPRATKKGPGAQFRAFNDGDIVRLRTRPLLSARTSIPLRVIDANPTADSLVVDAVRPQDLTNLDAEYQTPAGTESIVMRPPRGVPAAQLGMVSERAFKWIQDHHNPLNAAANAEKDRPWDDLFPNEVPGTAPAFDPPAMRPKGPRYSSSIVGLFEGGADTTRDVYRPTGMCLMRTLDRRFPEKDERIYIFCPVCRYVIVDKVDPAQHGAIDRDYDTRYLK